MRVLDCESIETTYISLESILGIQRDKIDTAFYSLDIKRFYIDNSDYPEDAKRLVFSVVTNDAPSVPDFDQVCWFHLTRTVETNTFEQGILPLSKQIDSIWDFLYTLVDEGFPKAKWNFFRQALGNDDYAHLYRMKTSDPLHWGPYAILIRDIAFKAEEVGNHDYLHVPEIIEDICQCFFERYRLDLLSVFLRNTRPCIVKFIDDNPRDEYIMKALYYLYTIYRGEEISQYCNTCFDGRGIPVPKEHILRVEFPDYQKAG